MGVEWTPSHGDGWVPTPKIVGGDVPPKVSGSYVYLQMIL